MERRLLALVMGALTLVGGHFVNRRWDRALLMFVLLILLGAGAYVAFTSAIMGAESGPGTVRITGDLVSKYTRLYAAGLFALWLVSLAVTAWDAWRPGDWPTRWSASAILGAIGLSAVCGFVLLSAASIWGVSLLYSTLPSSGPVAGADRDTSIWHEPSGSFRHYVYYGSLKGSPDALPTVPEGDGYLQGRFEINGEPVPGIELYAVLDETYKTRLATTDARGVFTFRVPPGDYSLSMVATETWRDQPAGGPYLIATGKEPVLPDHGTYSSRSHASRGGLKVSALEAPGEPAFTLSIRPQMKVLWPPKDAADQPVDAATATIQWEPHPGAQQYNVTISHVTRTGSGSRSWSGVVSKVVRGESSLPLSSLQTIPADNDMEYLVEVAAFDADGNYLSESAGWADESSFVLAGRMQLIPDEHRTLLPGATASDYEKIAENHRRITAIEVLAKDGLLDEAEALLGKLDGPMDPGRKSAVTGYLLALRGRCEEARALWSKAESAGGKACVPMPYREVCP